MLSKFNLLEAAVDFACDNKNYDFAFEIAKAAANKTLLQQVHYKQALDLEDAGKYKEAEVAFIQSGKPKEAILMYIHEEDWDSAFTIAEKHEPSALHDILLGQAKSAFAKKDFIKTETLLLRAQNFDAMIQLYKENEMWKEAIQFAKEYAPGKVMDLLADHDRYLASRAGSSVDEIMATARSLERNNSFIKSIEMYLRINVDITTDFRMLESAWTKAVELAGRFAPERVRDVVLKVTERLVKLKKYDDASKLLIGIGDIKAAIDICLSAQLWDQAREIAKKDSQYTSMVENAYVTYLKSQGKADTLLNIDLGSALEMFAERGEWEKCLDQAANSKNVDFLNRYLMRYTKKLMEEGNMDFAAIQLAKYGAPAVPDQYPFYENLTKQLLQKADPQTVASARDILFKLVGSFQTFDHHFLL